jgi:hypothetical protein
MAAIVDFELVGTIYIDADLTNMSLEQWKVEASRWLDLLSRYPNLHFSGMPKPKRPLNERRAVLYWFNVMIDGEVGGELWYGQDDKIEILVLADNKPRCAEMVIALAQEFAATLGGRFEREVEPYVV